MFEKDDLYTDALHAGQEADPATGARAPPIYQTTSYEFEDAEHAAEMFALEDDPAAYATAYTGKNIYSRIQNPTTMTLENRLATLEGGIGSITTSSGMAALDLGVFLLAEGGDNIVSSSALYGGTYTYFTHTVERRGVSTRFVDTLDYEAYAEAIDEDTAFVHVETIGNPALVTPDLERLADIAHDAGVPLFVDNTFATPCLCRPIEHGADLVWNSTTKWIHGSGSTIGGVLVDSGNSPWGEWDYPEISEDNPAYHGVNFAERFGDAAFTYAARARGLRDLGNHQSPFDAWITLQKVETLPLRMERHCENAMVVAEYLSEHPAVSWINYPGLDSHETHGNASEYLDGGYGGMITFGLEDGYEAARDAVNNVELASLLANVGDAKTLIIHPASTTHQQLTDEEKQASGVTDDLIRLSVGLEDTNRIIEDLESAIEAATN
ncbi:MAG: O-acetylhomoserine (thiol)-lyase [Natronomonas sp.]|jgi:O-acetylhomoserine (thiol)-lyase|uniref:O-acetylhomoserine aminocarboxypropyltransferase/cysteine synthase family protein n=1 Tax=Natronomonas sp. TaxID=2184060 RepID=UPI003989E291